MEINRFDMSRLRGEEHFQYMTDVERLIKETTPQVLNIEKLFPVFQDLRKKEDLALEVIRKNALTNSITEMDITRDALYKGFCMLVDAHTHSMRPIEVEAARLIKIVVDHYGNFRDKPYNEETATIYNFLQEINSRCAMQIEIIGAKEWIEDLAEINKKFEELMNRRFDDKAEQESIILREVRKEIDTAYTQIINRINAHILLMDANDSLSGFVSRMNERIVYYKNTIATRKGRANAKKNEEENEETSER